MAGGEFSLAVYENDLVCALGPDYFTQTGAIEQGRQEFVNRLRLCPMETMKGRANVICIA